MAPVWNFDDTASNILLIGDNLGKGVYSIPIEHVIATAQKLKRDEAA